MNEQQHKYSSQLQQQQQQQRRRRQPRQKQTKLYAKKKDWKIEEKKHLCIQIKFSQLLLNDNQR